MSEISQLQINGTTYDLVDATARNNITSITNLPITIEDIDTLLTPASNYTWTMAALTYWNQVAVFYGQFTYSAAMAANSQYNAGTLKPSYWPRVEAYGAGGQTDHAFIQSIGNIFLIPSATKSANATSYVKCMYLLASKI